jgi:hypothetical protein
MVEGGPHLPIKGATRVSPLPGLQRVEGRRADLFEIPETDLPSPSRTGQRQRQALQRDLMRHTSLVGSENFDCFAHRMAITSGESIEGDRDRAQAPN